MQRKNGFTLIELLVVIAIIAILAAILFPVFTSAKETGRKAVCLGNMRQIGMATMQYVSDNNGTYPFFDISVGYNTPGNWQSCWSYVLKKYVGTPKVFQCPSGKGQGLYPEAWAEGVRHDYLTPGYPYYNSSASRFLFGCHDWYGNPTWPAANGGDVRVPSRVVMIYELMPGYHPGWCYGWFYPEYYKAGAHTEGCNYTFGDGHAKWYRTDNLKPTDFSRPEPVDWKTAHISMRINYVP